MGDGTLSRFPSSLDAVLAAVEIQRELVAQDISVRIGIHVGEVFVEEEDLVGDAVNIASRIESFAVPGGVMLSDTAFDQLRNRTDIGVVSLGKFRLKNVGRPFELFAVAAEGVVVPNPNALEGKGERYASLPSNLPLPSMPLLGLGYLGLGDTTGVTWAEESIERSRAEGFLWAEGFALTADGMLRSLADDQNEAEEQFAAALAIQRSLGDEEGAGLSLGGLASLAARRDDLDTALDLYLQSLDAFAICGDRAEEARIVAELAWTQLRQGTTGLARRSFLASVQAYTDVGSVRGVGIALTGLAATEAADGRLELAVQLATAAGVYATLEGIANVYSDETPGRELIEQARAALSEDVAARAAEIGRALSIGDSLALVRSN